MTQIVALQPLLPSWALAALGVAALVLLGFALWRGLKGWAWRALALGLVLMALANPALQHEDRMPLSDIVILVVDDSASQTLSDRAFQTAQAVEAMKAKDSLLPNTE
jgi:hypothetical protein